MGQPISVVIVDDDKLQRIIMETLVNNSGGKVIGMGKNGKQAIKLYKKLKPDVILLDYMMPKMGGNAAAREILKTDPAANIVMVSGYNGNSQVVADSKEYGVLEWLTKGGGNVITMNDGIRGVLAKVDLILNR